MLDIYYGSLHHDQEQPEDVGTKWEGQPEEGDIQAGDAVVRPRLPLRPCLCFYPWTNAAHTLWCRACTLTVWVNDERKGVMVRPGMADEEGAPVSRLEGPLRWADGYDCCMAIEGPLPPPA